MKVASRFKRKTPVIYAILAVILFLAVVGGVALVNNVYVRSVPYSTPMIMDRVLINGTITVNPGLYYIEFTVPKEAFQISVSGNFSANSGEAINVYLMNQTTFKNWGWGADNPSLKPDYTSGQVTAANLSAELNSSGTYYLIYDNGYQPASKTVITEVSVHYLSF